MEDNKNLFNEFTGDRETDRQNLRELVKAIRNAKNILQTAKLDNNESLAEIFNSLGYVYGTYSTFIGGKIFNLKDKIKNDAKDNPYKQLEPYFKYLSAFDYTTSASYGTILSFAREENKTALNYIFVGLGLYFSPAGDDDVHDREEEFMWAVKRVEKYRDQAIDELTKGESIIINLGKRLYGNNQSKNESSNKYIKSFRESVDKLEEDDGNPSLLQAIDYNVDNDQMKHDDRFQNLSNKIYDAYAIADNLYHEYEDNKKLKKVKDLLHDAAMYLAGEITKKLDRNEFVNTSYYDDIEPEYDLQNYDYQNDK